jgi:iron complex transport system substrate-binding protein
MLSIVLALLMGLMLPACGQQPADNSAPPSPSESASTEQSGQSASPAQTGEITVVDQAGREVAVGADVQRIVSCYYISSSACIAMGLGDRIVGIEARAESRPIYRLAAPDLLDIPNVGSAREFNMEACINLDPDLVILPKRLQDNADTMAELGIPVILVSPESHDELVEMLTLIGQATGRQDAAARLIDYYNAELKAIDALTADITGKPSVYMCGNSAYLSTAPKDMYQASLIESAGGVNAARDIDGNNWIDVSYEQILQMNPDIIVIPAEASFTKDDIMNDAQLAAVAAVSNGQVYQMPTDFEAWDSPVPSCILGIKWLLSVLHEDVYPLSSLQQDAADFYKEFYGIDIDASLVTK